MDYDYFATPLKPAPVPPPSVPPPSVPPPSLPPPPAPPTAPLSLSPDEQLMLAQGRMASEQQMGAIAGVRPGRRLGFLEAVQVGLDLARSTWTVVVRAPELLLVTFVSLVVSGLFAAGYLKLLGGTHALVGGGRLVVAVKLFPLLAVLAVVGVCAQAIVVVVAREVVDGRHARVVDGWMTMMTRLPVLVGFGLVYAAERTMTNMLRNARGGRLAADLVDRAWDFATFLAVPVIVSEPGVGPLSAVRRSAQLVRQRMGSQAAATGVIGVAVFVCTLPVLLVAIVFGLMVSPMTAIALAVFVLVLEITVASTLQGVLSAITYRFVCTGAVMAGFAPSQLTRVFGVNSSDGWLPAPA
jgi:hypothetical protein